MPIKWLQNLTPTENILAKSYPVSNALNNQTANMPRI